MTTPNDASNGLTPERLANQLFDAALTQNMGDPSEVARRVIEFLTSSLFYAVNSSKTNVIVFLTETLILMISATSPDEAARKEMLKHVGDTIANAQPIPAATPAASKP